MTDNFCSGVCASTARKWDILSTGSPIQEMVHIAKGHKQGNFISLLRASPTNANESRMLILQETRKGDREEFYSVSKRESRKKAKPE